MALTEREPRASRGLPAASLRNTVADTEPELLTASPRQFWHS